MSMLRNDYETKMEQVGYAMKQERCKPDFEAVIASARKKQDDCQALLDAITNLTGGNSIEGKMAELVGEVYGMLNTLSKRIESLIKEEENWIE